MVEGGKSVAELLASDFEVVSVLATPQFLSETQARLKGEVLEVTEGILETLGEFRSNHTALAIAKIKPNSPLQVGPAEYGLVLDDIRDPGNLGTIIRTADWYGISKIIVSPETADFYNPKVITATMGSFTRVQVYYTELGAFLTSCDLPVYGAFLEGANVHHVAFKSGGLVVIGSESHGISAEVERCVTEKITIPRFGAAESLNAGIATAVICDNIRRGSKESTALSGRAF